MPSNDIQGCKCTADAFLLRRCRWCFLPSQWRHNEPDGISNHQPNDCLLNRLFRRSSKKTSKLRVTGLCAGNSPGTGEFPAQMASNAENVSIWWRHHVPYYHDQTKGDHEPLLMARPTMNDTHRISKPNLIKLIIKHIRFRFRIWYVDSWNVRHT